MTETRTPFDYVNAIYSGKNIIESELDEKEYNPFIINKALSMGIDTVIPANEMNCRAHLEKRMQNIFLINIVEPRKRFNKWLKSDKNEKDIELVQEYYGYNITKARQVLSILSEEQIGKIKEKLFKGGT